MSTNSRDRFRQQAEAALTRSRVASCGALVLWGLSATAQSIEQGATASWLLPCRGADGTEYKSDFEGTQVREVDPRRAVLSRGANRVSCELGKPGRVSLGTASVDFEGGVDAERSARIVDDPDRPGNHVLRFSLQAPNVRNARGAPVKGRVQLNVYGNKGVTTLDASVRMRLSGAFPALAQHAGRIDWLTISEWWNNPSWTQQAHPFRISVNLVKTDASAGSPMRLAVHAQLIDRGAGKANFRTLWTHVATDFAVPMERWMRVQYTLVEGLGDRGLFRMTVTPEGGAEQVVFDVKNTTHHPDDPRPDGWSHVNPLKIYTSVAVLAVAQRAKQPLTIDWDDLVMRPGPER